MPPEPDRDCRSDQTLVALCNRGDTAAFEALYYRYRDWVLRLAWRFTGDRADALDAMQETFTYLLGKFPGLCLTASMTTFLYPVVKNTSIRIRQKRRRMGVDEAALDAARAADAPRSASADELRLVLSCLPEAQREVVLMRFVDDMSLEAIASALAIPAGTVKSRLHHAMKTLREDPRTRRYYVEASEEHPSGFSHSIEPPPADRD